MRKKEATILSIGERKDSDAFLKFNSQKDYIRKRGFRYRSLSFKNLFKKNLSVIKDKKVLIFIFFPFYHWDRYIEHKNYRGTYGNLTFYNKFMKYSKKVFKRLNEIIIADEIILINDPILSAYYRDKAVVKRVLSAKGVNVARSINPASINHIERFLKDKRKLFIKPRCGSMGKGMTYLEKDKWQTNFDIQGGRIVSIRSDYGWKFRDVTGNSSFLKKLLEKDMIVEEAVDPFQIKGNIVDFRVYGFSDKILYIYPRKNKADSITTNISQGGRGAPGIRSFLSKNAVKKIEEQALLAMKALGLSFVGLDIMLNKNKSAAYVLDVNMFAGFPKIRTYNLTRSLITELSKT